MHTSKKLTTKTDIILTVKSQTQPTLNMTVVTCTLKYTSKDDTKKNRIALANSKITSRLSRALQHTVQAINIDTLTDSGIPSTMFIFYIMYNRIMYNRICT